MKNLELRMCYMFFDSGWICGQIDDFDNFSVSRMQDLVVLQYAVWDIQQRPEQGFFPGGGGLGVPPSGENFANPPIRHLSPFLDQGLFPPPAEVRPRKFEKFKYIFVSNLTTFKLKSTLKSCISCLK